MFQVQSRSHQVYRACRWTARQICPLALAFLAFAATLAVSAAPARAFQAYYFFVQLTDQSTKPPKVIKNWDLTIYAESQAKANEQAVSKYEQIRALYILAYPKYGKKPYRWDVYPGKPKSSYSCVASADGAIPGELVCTETVVFEPDGDPIASSDGSDPIEPPVTPSSAARSYSDVGTATFGY